MLEKIELVLKELKLKIDFEILNGLPSDDLFRPFNEYCRNQKDGSYYMELKKRGKPKSNRQIRYWWGIVIGSYCEAQGIQSIEKDVIYQIHTMLKIMYWGEIERKLASGKVIKYVKSMKNAEMSEVSYLIDQTIIFFAKNGIVVPSPTELTDEEIDKMFYKYKV